MMASISERRSVQLNYIGEVLGNPSGGLRQGAIYDGRMELAIDADMEKIANLKGGLFHANAYWIHGAGLSRYYLGNRLTASNFEALPMVRLFELWYEHKAFDDRLGVKFGHLAADAEFFVSEYSALFINGTFGWPAFTGGNLPSGESGSSSEERNMANSNSMRSGMIITAYKKVIPS